MAGLYPCFAKGGVGNISKRFTPSGDSKKGTTPPYLLYKKENEKQMKTLTTPKVIAFYSIFFFLIASAAKALAQDPSAGKLKCTFTIPVAANVTNQQAYELAAEWFAKNGSQLTRSNLSEAAQCAQCTNAANLAEVNHEFANSSPVQSLDPESNRIAARVVTKYFGSGSSTIRAMYVQYYLIVSVVEHQIVCEIKDIRYNHFNEHNYQFKRIQNWGNSTSLDPVNTFDYLVANEQSHEEFNKFYSFLNKETNQLVAQFGNYVASTVSQN